MSVPYLRGNALYMTSPSLLPRPADLPQDQLLAWQALPLLAACSVDEAQAAKAPLARWDFMASVVYRWLLAEHNELHVAWRADLLAWRSDAYAQDALQPAEVTEQIRSLCRTHQGAERALWLHGSGAAELCLSPDRLELARLLEAEDIGALWEAQAKPFYPYGDAYLDRVDPLLATTVLDYAVAEYGPDAVARLWQGFHDYPTWDELIPAVFDVTAQKFERGWQGYQMQLPDGLGAE